MHKRTEARSHKETTALSVGIITVLALNVLRIVSHRVQGLVTKDCRGDVALKKTRTGFHLPSHNGKVLDDPSPQQT